MRRFFAFLKVRERAIARLRELTEPLLSIIAVIVENHLRIVILDLGRIP
jgi:hypothetical protein